MRYKLTTQDMKTRVGNYNETQWTVGEWIEATGDITQELCTDAYIHWYEHPLLAVLLNPIHADIDDPRLWEIETDGEELMDYGSKGGSRRVRLMRELPVPEVTLEQRIRFGILCAKQVCKDAAWNTWADGWLSGADRSAGAAIKATHATSAAAYAANAAVYAADDNATSAAAAYAACAARVARVAARGEINLVEIAEEAIRG